MSALDSLSTAWTAFRRNPVILAGALVFVGLGQLYLVADVYVGPHASAAVNGIGFFLTPFLLGGVLTMAREALSGSTTFASFLRGGREYYVSLLAASIVLVGIVIGLVLAGAVVGLVAGLGVIASGGFEGPSLLVLVGVFGLVFVAVLVVMVFLQFYSAAIVVGGSGALDSFAKSASVVRANLVSVVGFSILFWGINWVGQLPGIALYVASVEFTQTGGTVLVSQSRFALSVALSLTLGTVLAAYAYTYFVEYYRSIAPDAPAA